MLRESGGLAGWSLDDKRTGFGVVPGWEMMGYSGERSRRGWLVQFPVHYGATRVCHLGVEKNFWSNIQGLDLQTQFLGCNHEASTFWLAENLKGEKKKIQILF